MKTRITIYLIIVLLWSCKESSIKADQAAIMGSWQPVATYYNESYMNVHRGWNEDRYLPAVTFRSDGTFIDPYGYVATVLNYRVISGNRIEFSGLYKGSKMPAYAFRADTLTIGSGTLPDHYTGTKYIRIK